MTKIILVWRLDGWADMGVDVPDETVSRHLDGLPLDHHLLHAARVVHLVTTDAELARPGERNQRKCYSYK